LSPNVDDATLNAAIERTIGQQKAREAAVIRATEAARAEARLQDEDRRIVEAAIQQGKVHASRQQFWLDALKRD
jgi:hypothetical protein